ncbi:MAG: class I SAM-dependent methyltransferase [Chitinophagaceae bacterium]|nr:class I SAM-dependent methyltransferase [Chitinophagaceae bacterium]MBK7307252.1 class I SAM-dependent methyltransferase [Chitinophagaceae bacterium]MBK8786249.1 class I SAM-dependent methyltransferase [Chitinophagaceae bacterium]MBK9485554.1 class I SAM-dependent methyltransferase [Chitinophagaceae bacterium]MBL0200138.1 class I SAM-dependent methyltransferase [Chitinophagaceae bacterium]
MSTGTLNTAVEFDPLYFGLRQKEGRIYTDEEVATLPFIYTSHPYYHEWVMRKHSQKALLSYINSKKIFSNILEVGCGNGWLSSRIAKETKADVTGLDINTYELQQAERVFRNVSNLNFISGSLQSDQFRDEKFDMILFAASIQYFPSLKQIIQIAIEHLTLQGEVHIMDSPFYHIQETAAASQRTKEYYKALGFEAMAGHYYHHQLAELEYFQYKILHHPNSWKNKLSIKKNPFYWISIKNRYQ